tara:strand:+ start:159 stop:656 length:498 start_codon:yes stop_codon:yes gene_type:complete
MKRYLAALALLVTVQQAYGDSIFDHIKWNRKPITLDKKVIVKRPVGNSGHFYYALEDISTIVQKEQPVQRVTTPPPPVVSPPPEPVPVSLPEKVATPTVDEAEKDSRDATYGSQSPLRDEYVVEAWRKADEAKKRLEEHRRVFHKMKEKKKAIERAAEEDIEKQP